MRYVLMILFVVFFTINFFMEGPNGIPGNFTVKLISYFNFLVFFSSIITMFRFFWVGDRINTTIQLFNLFFAVIFYIVSFTFLLHHKGYYDGYAYLSDFGCIQRFASRWDIFSIMFWFILVACILNVTYLIRFKEGEGAFA